MDKLIEEKARMIVCGEHHKSCDDCAFNSGACDNLEYVEDAIAMAKWTLEQTKQIISENDINSEKGALKKNTATKIREKVDELFALKSNSRCNLLILTSANVDENGHYKRFNLFDSFGLNIDWSEDGKSGKYEKFLEPKINEHNNWARNVCYNEENERIGKQIYNLTKRIVPSATKYFDKGDLNECWYGVIAITKQYKIIPFIVRDDAYMMDANHIPSSIMAF